MEFILKLNSSRSDYTISSGTIAICYYFIEIMVANIRQKGIFSGFKDLSIVMLLTLDDDDFFDSMSEGCFLFLLWLDETTENPFLVFL